MKSLVNLLVCLLLLSACAEQQLKYEGEPSDSQSLRAPDVLSLNRQPSKIGSKPVWERWQNGLDRNGQVITNPDILMGDNLSEQNNSLSALERYKAALKSVSSSQRLSLIERIAATEMTLDRSKDALATLSSYYRSLHATISMVEPDIAILFAYAYGRERNVEQSLAWFDKILQQDNESLARKELAKRGTARLLSALSGQELEILAEGWSAREQINYIIGQERKRRAELGIPDNLAAKKPFWEEFDDQAPANQFVQTESNKRIAVMLPLSGRFAALGEKIQHGIELARDSFPDRDNLGFDFTFEDTTSSPNAVQACFDKASSPVSPLFVIGPLLAESAAGVADLARERGIPMLSFSKRADLKTGRGVFRLAPTAESQVKALINNAQSKFGLSKFAIVATDDAFGQEFLKAFHVELETRNLLPVFEQLYAPRDDVAIFKMAQAIEKLDVDALLIADPSVSNAAHVFLSILEDKRAKITVLAPAGWDNLRELKKVQNAFEGALLVSLFPETVLRDDIQDFIIQYNKRFGVKPDFFAAQGFDAATLVMSAVARSITQDRPVAQVFAELEPYRGLTGQISVMANGEVSRSLPILQFVKGELVEPKIPLFKAGPEQQSIGSAVE